MNSIELKNLAGGAVQEQFARAFEKVVANLQDPNTPYKSGREITIKLKFEQNERRDDVQCALFEADGGAWAIAAMQRIRRYLETALSDVDGLVVIS